MACKDLSSVFYSYGLLITVPQLIIVPFKQSFRLKTSMRRNRITKFGRDK